MKKIDPTSLKENPINEVLKKKNKQFKIYATGTVILAVVFSILTFFFITAYLAEPLTPEAFHLFMVDMAVLIIFVFILEKLLAAKEDSIILRSLKKEGSHIPQKEKYPKTASLKNEDKLEKKNGIIPFLSNIFTKMEDFPFIQSKTGRKKRIFQILGWTFLILLLNSSIYFHFPSNIAA